MQPFPINPLKFFFVLPTVAIVACGIFGPNEKPYDPAKLTWTADTIRTPQVGVDLLNIWGGSANDVYAVGHGGPIDGVWHFNGKSWESGVMTAYKGGTIEGSFSLDDITGFAADDVWAVGRTSCESDGIGSIPYCAAILHYDGISWARQNVPIGEYLYCIAGYAPDNIWAGSLHGRLWHYDGNEWTIDSTSIPLPEIYDPENWGYFARLAVLGPNQIIGSYEMPGGSKIICSFTTAKNGL